MTHGSLFDWSTRRASVEALERLTPERLRADHLAILRALEAGPLSDQELQEATGVHPNAIRARRGELSESGRIFIAGKKPNRHGRNVTTWGLGGRRQEGASDDRTGV